MNRKKRTISKRHFLRRVHDETSIELYLLELDRDNSPQRCHSPPPVENDHSDLSIRDEPLDNVIVVNSQGSIDSIEIDGRISPVITDSNSDNSSESLSVTGNEFILSQINDREIYSEQIKKNLVQWALNENITHKSFSALLKIMKVHPDFKNFPSDARSILGTPRETIIQDICGGEFVYFGLKENLTNILSREEFIPHSIELLIGIDGLPISKSSGSQLWPQLCKIRTLPHTPVFVVGVFHGEQKPTDANLFLSRIIHDLHDLLNDGFYYRDTSIEVSHVAFVCDAPAKSFILQVKGHTGYFSCTRCETEGFSKKRRLCFSSKTHQRKRTHESFIKKRQEEHHLGDTILSQLPSSKFDVIRDFPIDYMHLVCLGIVKKLLKLWLKGDLSYRLPFHAVERVTDLLNSYRPYIPKEFVRKPRALQDVGRWKATELRQFLLYTGLVILKQVKNFKEEVIENFFSLSIAINLVLNPTLCREYQSYARSLLEYFVLTFEKIYGAHLLSYNVHGILHLADDVSTFGSLDTCSAFQFENFMFRMKKLLRKQNQPLQQIARRIQENVANETISLPGRELEFKINHESGPLLDGCTSPQYKTLVRSNFQITCNLRDSHFIKKDGTLMKVRNFAFSAVHNEMVAIGHTYDEIGPLFMKPCNSTDMKISIMEERKKNLIVCPVKDINQKAMILPFKKDKIVMLPLIHSEV